MDWFENEPPMGLGYMGNLSTHGRPVEFARRGTVTAILSGSQYWLVRLNYTRRNRGARIRGN